MTGSSSTRSQGQTRASFRSLLTVSTGGRRSASSRVVYQGRRLSSVKREHEPVGVVPPVALIAENGEDLWGGRQCTEIALLASRGARRSAGEESEGQQPNGRLRKLHPSPTRKPTRG
jgi:hypothetical protein